MSDEVDQVIVIDSQSWTGCTLCGQVIGAVDSAGMHGFEERVNHLLSEHALNLLHVGQHTGRSHEGDSFHHIVAVLGLPR